MRERCNSLYLHSWGLKARALVTSGALLFAIASAESAPGAPGVGSRDATATADAFVDAIGRGNRAAARELLMPDVTIFESGNAERSADEYSTHHLPADIQFMARMRREVGARQTGGDSTTAWVATTTRIRGQYKGKAVDLDSTETLILTLTTAGWRIAHIHWSSSPHRAPSPAP